MKDLRIIFMGTPDFAAPSLEILVNNNYNVVAVITAPDKPRGRGREVSSSVIKQVALKHKLPVLQPKNLKDPEFLNQLKSYNADLQVVVAFRMLPEAVWKMPEYGTINLHASLLPQYRGAAPINWAIINGEKETGVTTFFLKHEIDTGNILFQEKVSIKEDDTAGTLHDRLKIKGANLILKTVKAVENNNYDPQPQEERNDLNKAPRIYKDDCRIDWTQSSSKIKNFVRGLAPYPAAWTEINGVQYKIFNIGIVKDHLNDHEPGDYKTDGKSFLYIKTGDGWVSIKKIQKQGKRNMTIKEFLRGNKI